MPMIGDLLDAGVARRITFQPFFVMGKVTLLHENRGDADLSSSL